MYINKEALRPFSLSTLEMIRLYFTYRMCSQYKSMRRQSGTQWRHRLTEWALYGTLHLTSLQKTTVWSINLWWYVSILLLLFIRRNQYTYCWWWYVSTKSTDLVRHSLERLLNMIVRFFRLRIFISTIKNSKAILVLSCKEIISITYFDSGLKLLFSFCSSTTTRHDIRDWAQTNKIL